MSKKRPSASTLRQLYHDNRLSTRKIAEQYDASKSTILRWMDEAGIEKRNKSQSQFVSEVSIPEKEDLVKMYTYDGLTIAQIADDFGVHKKTVRKWMGMHEIDIRDPKDSRLPINFERPLGNELKELYIEKRLSTRQIAGHYNVSKSTIRSWMEEMGIKRRDRSQSHLARDIKIPSKGDLEGMYHRDELTIVQIAAHYGVSKGAICNWLSSHGIKKRDRRDSKLPNGFQRPTKDELQKLYIDGELSTIQIAEQYGVNRGTIYNWLVSHDIERRSKPLAVLTEGMEKPSEDELRELYVSQKLSTTQIGEQYGVSSRTISNWMGEFGIERRSQSEAHLTDGTTKPSSEELRRLYWEENLNTVQLGRHFNVHPKTISRWMKRYGISQKDGAESSHQLETLLQNYAGGKGNG